MLFEKVSAAFSLSPRAKQPFFRAGAKPFPVCVSAPAHPGKICAALLPHTIRVCTSQGTYQYFHPGHLSDAQAFGGGQDRHGLIAPPKNLHGFHFRPSSTSAIPLSPPGNIWIPRDLFTWGTAFPDCHLYDAGCGKYLKAVL